MKNIRCSFHHEPHGSPITRREEGTTSVADRCRSRIEE